jgi:hypothetical protein
MDLPTTCEKGGRVDQQQRNRQQEKETNDVVIVTIMAKIDPAYGSGYRWSVGRLADGRFLLFCPSSSFLFL